MMLENNRRPIRFRAEHGVKPNQLVGFEETTMATGG